MDKYRNLNYYTILGTISGNKQCINSNRLYGTRLYELQIEALILGTNK
nr:hypothetical protein [Mycoplasmopsis bovis]